MITLNDYLYTGDTVFRIIQKYSRDLREDAKKNHNELDLVHVNFLIQINELLEHNEFLTSQSQKLRDFYMYMVKKYPYLAFAFKGRIKSLIRAEEKFNGYIVEYIYEYFKEHKTYPSIQDLKNRLSCFRDLIAYRIIISLPKCQTNDLNNRENEEIRYLYEIANILPAFLEERGFTVETAGGYQSLHITFYDNSARCYMEVQLRTKEMDDYAEIGPANHLGYEKQQERDRSRRDLIPRGECVYFDDAYERGMLLRNLELKDLDVNMFAAVNNSLINDGCGLYRGRLILPYEHLSRFQSDAQTFHDAAT